MTDSLTRALRQIGLSGQFQFKFGPGITAKTSGALMITVPAIVAAAIFMPEGAAKPFVVFGLIGLVAFYLLGTWVHTALTPQSALEGAHLVAYQQATLGAKGLPAPPANSPILSNPEYHELPSHAAENRGDA